MSATPALLVTTFLRERIGALLGVVVVLCNLAAIALGALSLQQSHQNAEAQAETAAVSLAHMLDQSLSSSARSIDVGLQALADELGREARGGSHYLQTDEVMALLARVKSWLPETEGIRVFDANGRPRWTQHSTPESAQETCQCFNTLRAALDGGLVVGRPIARRGAAGWLIPFSRRISGPGGRFSGIVSVTVPLDAFTELLARPLLGKGGSAILRYRDFGLITQVPPVAGAAGVVGHVWIAEEIRSRFAASQTSFTYSSAVTSDKIERLHAVRQIEGLPFFLTVGFARDHYLAQWRRDAAQTVAMLVVFL